MRFPDDVPTLSDGGVVTLRAHDLADVPRILSQCRDPESIRWTTVPSPYATADAEQFVTEILPQGWTEQRSYGFAIEYYGAFAGSIDLRLRGGGEAEIGFGLHPEVRGRGVMHRALNLILDWGFATCGLEVVHWRALVGNWSSRRAVWRVGFSAGPTIPRMLPDRGERADAWTGWIGRLDPREPAYTWLEPPEIEAGRVRLRAWRETDGERLTQARQDPVLRAWMPDNVLPEGPEQVPDYLLMVRDGAANGSRLAWCVADADSDEALGSIALFDFEDSPGDMTAQVGYWCHPYARGRGAMTAALRAVCHWAMRPVADDGLGVRRLYLLTSVYNARSRALAERAGFRWVGTERESAPAVEGYRQDSALYDLLRTDLSQR